MELPQRLTVPSEVMARQVGDETVLLDLASGNYFGLDEVGARIWQLLVDGKAPAEICEILLVEYDTSREMLENDVGRLLKELAAHGLVISNS
jgi:DNA-binding CsgD family transcriptional regulator